jgi:hypothetical protein
VKKLHVVSTWFLALSIACDVLSAKLTETSSVKASPAVVINGSSLTVNGKQVQLGDSFDAWKSALPGQARCMKTKLTAMCFWDDIGIEVGSDLHERSKVVL